MDTIKTISLSFLFSFSFSPGDDSIRLKYSLKEPLNAKQPNNYYSLPFCVCVGGGGMLVGRERVGGFEVQILQTLSCMFIHHFYKGEQLW